MAAHDADGFRFESAEVLYSASATPTATHGDVDMLKALSARNVRRRVRLCAHSGPDDRLHEMLIVHERCAYVRPHRHPGKTESMHVIEGQVDVVVLSEAGAIEQVIAMGDYASGRTFYYRMEAPLFHTLIIRSEVLVFHETTNGPFDRSDTEFAPWAPTGDDPVAVQAYLTDLDDRIGRLA